MKSRILRFIQTPVVLLMFFVLLTITGCGRRESPDALLFRARSEARNGRWEEAFKLSGKALEQHPDHFAGLLLHALSAERTGKTGTALSDLNRAVRIKPDCFEAQYLLGGLYVADRERRQDAILPLTRALELKKGDRNTLILLANASMELDANRALGYLSMLARDRNFFESAACRTQLGICQLRRGNDAQALQSFLAAYRKAPSDPVTVLNLGVFLDRFYRRPEQARAFYKRYLALIERDKTATAARSAVEQRMAQTGK